MSVYYCKYCGRKITESSQVTAEKTILEIPGYACTALLLKPGSENMPPLSHLERRNDEILPEVWSCCRIAAVRSWRDNPDGGPVVYSDCLLKLQDGVMPPPPDASAPHHTRRLTGVDFERTIDGGALPENSGKLYAVKFTALWCPPCRAMDYVFQRLAASGELPGVEFFEVDSDREQDLADSFFCPSLPYIVFFKAGKRLDITRAYLGAVNGGYSGAMGEDEFKSLCVRLLDMQGA